LFGRFIIESRKTICRRGLMSAKTLRYHKKVVSFGEDELILWSLDGNTWSTRKEELVNIQERHENERVTFEQIRSGNTSKRKAKENTDPEQQPEAKTAPSAPKKSTPEKTKVPTKQERAPRAKAKVATAKTTSKRSSTSTKSKTSPKKRSSSTPKKKTSAKAKKTRAA